MASHSDSSDSSDNSDSLSNCMRKLISGGYDYQFVEEPSDDLKCLICLCVARDPQQHGEGGCGKIYCKSCIDKYKTKNRDCPSCRIDITTFKDVRSEFIRKKTVILSLY